MCALVEKNKGCVGESQKCQHLEIITADCLLDYNLIRFLRTCQINQPLSALCCSSASLPGIMIPNVMYSGSYFLTLELLVTPTILLFKREEQLKNCLMCSSGSGEIPTYLVTEMITAVENAF